MSNTVLNPTIIAKAAIRILDNELVMANKVYRGYEDEFGKKINGYEVGDTITVRKPNQFTVRDGATAQIQDVTEGKQTFQVNKQKGVDFKFTTSDLTLKIGDLAERVIRPAMIQLANQVDKDVMALYQKVYNWVGTPGQNVASFAGFAKALERLDLTSVPTDARAAVLSPTDNWAMAGSQTALYLQTVGNPAYRKGSLGDIGGVEPFMAQNIPTFTAGSRVAASTSVVGATNLSTTYASVLNSESVPGILTGFTMTSVGTSATVAAGDVFTIAGIYAVNPVTKATLAFLQQFVVQTAATADGSGNLSVDIAPAIITSGAFQTVSAAPVAGNAVTWLGTASTGYLQNLVFHKNAFGLVVVPMVRPPGAVQVGRESYKGLSVRVVPYYDGTNDVSQWRLDVLYGVKCIDPRLATRLSGT